MYINKISNTGSNYNKGMNGFYLNSSLFILWKSPLIDFPIFVSPVSIISKYPRASKTLTVSGDFVSLYLSSADIGHGMPSVSEDRNHRLCFLYPHIHFDICLFNSGGKMHQNSGAADLAQLQATMQAVELACSSIQVKFISLS